MTELMRVEATPPAPAGLRQENIWIDQYLEDRQGEIAWYFRVLLERKWIVLSVMLLVLSAAIGWLVTAQRLYTSSVNIQIELDRNVLPYRETYETDATDPRYLLTQGQVLKSEALARRTVIRLKLATPDSANLMAVAREFAGHVSVSLLEGTHIVKASYQGEDPEFAARAVDALADAYMEYGVEVKQEGTTAARDFLDAELVKLAEKLKSSEEQAMRYAREHSIPVAIDGKTSSANAVEQKLAALNAEMSRVDAEMLSNQYQGLKGISLDSFPDKLKTAVMRDLESRRSTLQQKLATLTPLFGPKWPEVITLNRELTEVGQQLTSEKQKIIDQGRSESNLAEAHRDRLVAALAEQKHLADRLNEDSIQFNVLKREADTNRQLHEGLLQRLKEMDVAAGLKSANVYVIDRARIPRLPSSPNIPLALGFAFVGSVLAGVFVGCAAEFLDRTVKTPEDVERELHMPFLGAIPKFSASWKQESDGALMPMRSQPERTLGASDNDSELYWESYRGLRTSLLFSTPDQRPASILVTSSVVGEGKTTTAVNLATALAQTGARTLLLELDLRRARLARLFATESQHGISRYLAGHSELSSEIQDTGIPNLFLLSSGPLPPNPPELIGSARMKAAFDLLSRHFTHIVVDSPPIMSVTDALVISTLVKGVVLVVEGKTSRTTAQMARNRLRGVGANLLGAVINNVKGAHSAYYTSTVYDSTMTPDGST